jgi:general secretion pathway protein G
MIKTTMQRESGFTLIELIIALAVLGVLASALFPMIRLEMQREHEKELRADLRQIRDALDAYKQAYDEGHIIQTAGASGYPPSLDTLVKGVKDAKSPGNKRLYFLRRIPRDPFFADAKVDPADTWGLRSYASEPDHPEPGKDVYDVYSTAQGVGLNGVPYREW